jgi:predicted glycogen debranching enzyme
MNITFGADILRDFATAAEREWLETNGIGGSASGTLSGANTRRYHGLLVAATLPPVHRMVMVAKLEELLVTTADTFHLSSNQYSGWIHPRGYRYLSTFHLAPCPTFVYQMGPNIVQKSVMMVHGENTTIVTYELLSAPEPAELVLFPYIAARDQATLARITQGVCLGASEEPGLIVVQPYAEAPPVYISYIQGRFESRPVWVKNVEYHWELARGLDYQEDLICPGRLQFKVNPGERIRLVLSLDTRSAADAENMVTRELARREALTHGVEDDFLFFLRRAADTFVVKRGSGKTVMAGYHWFYDWGRDTMISLPGLTLVLGKPETARDILTTFSKYVHKGLLPCRFPDEGQAPLYHTVDAALWYAYAAEKYLEATNDLEFARHVLHPTLAAIVAGYRAGTNFNIHMAEDGLITQGQEGYALTWMDAKMGDWVVTPRRGKAVEINALWFNALVFLAELTESLCLGPTEELRTLATRVSTSFARQFWYKEGGYLYDVVSAGGNDPALRPNQLYALSLKRPLLAGDRARSVMRVVTEHLYTPLGIRSLSPTDAEFMARYEGDLARRDGAYHRGAVWGFLIGPYVTAYLNVFGRTPETLAAVRNMLRPFRHHLLAAGLGTVSEIFDGEEPFRPAGCISQAWSVAELLRIIYEELRGHP